MHRLLPLPLIAALMLSACADTAEETATAAGTGGAGVAPHQGSGISTAPATKNPPLDPVEAARGQLASIGDRVFFATDAYTLTQEAKATLDQQIAWLNRFPMLSLVIEGHADERGTREYNLALGDRRAQSVKKYLTDNGIPPSRLRSISYGKERPVALGSNEASWAKNRRAVSVVGQ